MIEIRSLFYQIDQKMILEDINLSFSKGKINLILGPNGSGKSTLLKCIAGSLKPSLGTITWNQQSLTSFTTAELAK
ncbi:MAG: ABC transporter ATP-binding protein, partial [Crocinitomicaceae bacterium]|nr:ABC transporter ATP-binding protein [Crocinitomicaceae bacterium]